MKTRIRNHFQFHNLYYKLALYCLRSKEGEMYDLNLLYRLSSIRLSKVYDFSIRIFGFIESKRTALE